MRFCIIGTGRCGSTLLRNMFNLHPDIFVYNETHWIPKMYEMFGTGGGYPAELARILLETYHITGKPVTPVEKDRILALFPDESMVSIQGFCNRVALLLANDEGKRLWADKTPDYGPWMSVIQRIWPECKFVHLMRHGAQTAISMSRHPGYRWMASARDDSWTPAAFNRYYEAVPVVERPLEDFGSLWYRRFRRIRNESKLLSIGSYREFRLESFVDEPVNTLKSIAKFVALRQPGSWIEESLSLLDPNRIRNAPIQYDFLGQREKQLLQDLGYSCSDQ